MSYRQLRALSRVDIAWRRVLAGWRDHDITACLGTPVPAGRYLAVSADNGAWRGLIDPREWLCHELPELAAMAGAACDDENIMALFNTRSRPLTFAHGALAYRTLQGEELVPRDPECRAALPRLSARECEVWVTGITDGRVMKPQTAAACVAGLPLEVEWLMGSSRLPRELAARLSGGDVLLINETKRQLRCQGMVIGVYSQNEEMIMIDEQNQHNGMSAGKKSPSAETAPISGALTQVPLNVEFILQRRYLTVGELQQLFKGKVLEIDPAGEKKIEIRANGHVLAVGELVQLEDRLGVEVMELHMDNLHGQ